MRDPCRLGKVETPPLKKVKKISYQVYDFNETYADQPLPSEVGVFADDPLGAVTNIEFNTGQAQWLPFYFSFPPLQTVAVEVSQFVKANLKAKGHQLFLQVSVEAPSDGGRALFHIGDVRFGDYKMGGEPTNFVCVDAAQELKGSYQTNFQRSSNITTFMQVCEQT